MTTELEQEFFKVFGIEPKYIDGCKLADNYWNNEQLQKKYKTFDEYLNINCVEGDSGACFSTCEFAYDCSEYPEITDRVLLELICILSRYNMGMFDHIGAITIKPYEIYACNIKELKEKVLQDAIIKIQELRNVEWQSLFKHQIQQLFKGGEE